MLKKHAENQQRKDFRLIKKHPVRLIIGILCIATLLTACGHAGGALCVETAPAPTQKSGQPKPTDDPGLPKEAILPDTPKEDPAAALAADPLPSEDNLDPSEPEVSEAPRDTGQSREKDQPAANEAPAAKKQQPSKAANPAASSSAAPAQGNDVQQAPASQDTPAHIHAYNIPVTKTHVRQVLVSEEQIEYIDTGRGKYICNGCGIDITDNLDHSLTCNGGSGYHMEPVHEQTIIPAQYTSESYEETVGYRCSCGALK